VSKEIFTTEKFIKAMKKTFVEAGQWPGEDGKFIKYMGHSKGKLNKFLLPDSAPEPTTLATLTTEFEVEAVDLDVRCSPPSLPCLPLALPRLPCLPCTE